MDKFEELIAELTKKISLETLNFIESEMNDEEKISDVLDLITKSHINSLFVLLNGITKDEPFINLKIRKFNSALRQYLDTYFEKQ